MEFSPHWSTGDDVFIHIQGLDRIRETLQILYTYFYCGVGPPFALNTATILLG
jgi:hypothetical protein